MLQRNWYRMVISARLTISYDNMAHVRRLGVERCSAHLLRPALLEARLLPRTWACPH